MIPALEIHLLESTAWAVLLILLALCLRKRGAAARHMLYLLAAAKFAVPFGIFIAIGMQFHRFSFFSQLPAVLPAKLADYSSTLVAMPQVSTRSAGFLILSISLWLAGTLILIGFWIRQISLSEISFVTTSERETRAFNKARECLGLGRCVQLRASSLCREPFLSGLWQPTITISENLSSHLSPEELEAILLHELAHARRRDNLSSAFAHLMLCLFWFHPLLWLIERRMLCESELACDELVLSSGAHANDYVIGILKVCQMEIGLAIPGVSAISSSNLKRRMEAIMSFSIRKPSARPPKLLLYTFVAAAIVVPMLSGFLSGRSVYGQSDSGNQQSSPQLGVKKPVKCTYASVDYPEGTVIQVEGLGQQMCASVLKGHDPENPNRLSREPIWIRTDETIRQRSQSVVRLTRTQPPKPFSCTPKPSSGTDECSCEERPAFSQGSVVDSLKGKLRCEKGNWVSAPVDKSGTH